MILKCVGSGSTGNAYVIEEDGNRLILDAGMPWKDIQVACGFDIKSIDGCLVTHEHGDHCKYAPKIIQNGIDCYTGPKAIEPVFSATGGVLKPVSERRWTSIGRWSAVAVEAHHDVPCYGFVIRLPGGEKLAYFTDYSYIGKEGKEVTLKNMEIDHWLIAVNYSGEPDTDTAKSSHIYGGHSGLDYVKRYLQRSMSENCKSIIACHLSNSNADEMLIINALTDLDPKWTVGICAKGRTFAL